MPLLPRLIFISLLSSCLTSLAATEAQAENFSSVPAIRQRMEQLEQESAKANEALQPAYVELKSALSYHLAAAKLFTNPPPASPAPSTADHSILTLDRLRTQAAQLSTKIHSFDTQIRLNKSELEATSERVESTQKKLRLLNDRKAITAGDSSASPHEKEIEAIHVRTATEDFARHQLRLQAFLKSKTSLEAELVEVTKTIDAIKDTPTFEQRDLTKILADLDREILAIKPSKDYSASPDLDPFQVWKLDFLNTKKEFWSLRYSLINDKSATNQKQTLQKIKALKPRIDDWAEFAHLRTDTSQAGFPTKYQHEMPAAIEQTLDLQRLLKTTIADASGSPLTQPVLDTLYSKITNLWDTELYLAENSSVANGQKVTIYRTVTLGKVVRLLFILIVGSMALFRFNRFFKNLLANRFGCSETSVEAYGKISFYSGLTLLLLYGLNTAKIPLAALTFLGGSFAIAFGFGMQTILKNFMSGLILLFERPVQIGDVVQVDQITGRIKKIGIRASLIQHFDGIETLVPNSLLLETQLTNWNLSDTKLRHSVCVGVAYGSNPRDVSRLLLHAAAEHGQILEHPEPEVRFEDFGSDALMFRLLFWIDTTKSPGRSAIASDLRFMIERLFSEAGIAMAFPQREIHFNPQTPIKLEIPSRNKPSKKSSNLPA